MVADNAAVRVASQRWPDRMRKVSVRRFPLGLFCSIIHCGISGRRPSETKRTEGLPRAAGQRIDGCKGPAKDCAAKIPAQGAGIGSHDHIECQRRFLFYRFPRHHRTRSARLLRFHQAESRSTQGGQTLGILARARPAVAAQRVDRDHHPGSVERDRRPCTVPRAIDDKA
jgi:hypothetical protein